jgi:hypothetical protein
VAVRKGTINDPQHDLCGKRISESIVSEFIECGCRSSWFAYAEPVYYIMQQPGLVVEFEYWDSPSLRTAVSTV